MGVAAGLVPPLLVRRLDKGARAWTLRQIFMD
jgi:hypothetical protein